MARRAALLLLAYVLAGALISPAAGLDDKDAGLSPITGGKLRLVADKGRSLVLTGDVIAGPLGNLRQEHSGHGVRFLSVAEKPAHVPAGSVSWTVAGVSPEVGRWFRFRIRGLAQEDFQVAKDDLYLRVEFFKDGGKNSLDFIKKSFYEQVEADRVRLADPSMRKSMSKALWRNYGFEFRTPFPEVDTLRLSVGFGNGTGKGARAEFWIGEVEITPIPDPGNYVAAAKPVKEPPALQSLVKLGGRWYYDPAGGSKEPPQQFDHSNAERLYYYAGRLETPFAGNTSAWLRRGYVNRDGDLVAQERFIPDNVVVSFTDRHLVIKSHNLPNHPTAVFPDRSRLLDGNPNYIREQINTWHIPLEPKVNPAHVAMDEKNTNKALKLGPIGVAVNGIVFLNPFDDSNERDAMWRLDRCCGHPSPGERYHYHKYPVCLNTPWLDDGKGHSPLIGFAFDGFPVYGPYEAAGLLARDAKDKPLNDFNLHHDAERGPHYHVTPGKFPHIIGGYWGEVDPLNRSLKKGPPFKKKKKL